MESVSKQNLKSFKVTYSSLIAFMVVFAFGFNFLGEISHGILRIGVFDEISTLFILFFGLSLYFSNEKSKIKRPWFISYYLFLSLIYFLFYKTTWLAFLYEYYKLFIFMIFLPLLNFIKPETLRKILDRFFVMMKYILFINLIFIFLQYITDNEILRIIKYNELRTDNWERYGRYTGLFDVATLGFTSLLVIFINEITNKNKNSYNGVLILALISVIFSSSKASYVILFVWLILYFKNYLVKHSLKIVSGILVFGAITYYYTSDTIDIKIKQYTYFIQNFNNRPVLNLAHVEKRVLFLAESMSIFKEHPFGLGFGTFGDASVKYNPEAYQISQKYWLEKNVDMSDSVVSHLLAEQGLTAILYLFMIVVAPLFFITRKLLKFYAMYVIFYIILAISTMGLTAGSFPILFAFIFGIFYYSKKFDEVFTVS